MAVRLPPTLPKISVSPDTHARVTLAATELSVSVFDFTERALKAELARARHQVKVDR